MLKGPGHNGCLSLLGSVLVLSMEVEARRQAAEKAQLCKRCWQLTNNMKQTTSSHMENTEIQYQWRRTPGRKTEEFMFVPGKG